MGGVHHVAHDETAVIQVGGILPVGQDDQQGGRTIEGVGVLASHDGGVQAHEAVAQRLVRHLQNDGALPSHAAGGIQTGFHDLIQQFLRDGVRFVPADAPPGNEGVQNSVFHGIFLLKK